ncbi:hypothetical protein RA210_U10315 [Rubrivivax sp. A210]|uniref:hypothetical protein n=1 Tax=Rubrivivax sp. A210 TaxID=2772301 RepID=UPI001917C7C6|nr:hypothetical protein [Rubrivivax sp. A210]CAD5366418.1 hypothetical protein RA210_U10315 [Rubrivivax sp. A210]
MLHLVVAKADNGRERYANHIVPTLQESFEVSLPPCTNGTYRKRCIGLFEGPSDLLISVRENRDGPLFWEVYNAVQSSIQALNKLHQGALLFGKALRGAV